jgi:hypothetical protein
VRKQRYFSGRLVEVAEGDYFAKARLFALESLYTEIQDDKVFDTYKYLLTKDPSVEIREGAITVLNKAGKAAVESEGLLMFLGEAHRQEVLLVLEDISQSDASEEVRKAAKAALEKLKAAKSAIEKLKSKSEK